MLLDLRRHLRTAGPATLGEIAVRLDVEPATAEGLLEILVRRGEVIRKPPGDCCAGCAGACSRHSLTLYRAARPA